MNGKENTNRIDNSFYVYNNEALVIGVIQGVLMNNKRMDIGRLFIITSLLLQDKLICNSRIQEYDSLKEFLNDNSKNIIQFPRVFQELLPIIMNALTLMEESDLIELEGGDIVGKIHDKYVFNSNRLINIENTIPKVLSLTVTFSGKQLYDLLNVQL